MSIRPVDIQASIFQATQNAAAARQAEAAPQLAQTLAGQQLAKATEQKAETVQTTDDVEGNRVREREEPSGYDHDGQQKRRKSGAPFGSVEESIDAFAAGEEHLIDFTA